MLMISLTRWHQEDKQPYGEAHAPTLVLDAIPQQPQFAVGQEVLPANPVLVVRSAQPQRGVTL
jgi:hypothetical protein